MLFRSAGRRNRSSRLADLFASAYSLDMKAESSRFQWDAEIPRVLSLWFQQKRLIADGNQHQAQMKMPPTWACASAVVSAVKLADGSPPATVVCGQRRRELAHSSSFGSCSGLVLADHG